VVGSEGTHRNEEGGRGGWFREKE